MDGVPSPAGSPPPAGFPVTPTHAAVPSVPARTRARKTPRINEAPQLKFKNDVTDPRPPPGMWTPLMTGLNCHVRQARRATGRRYTRGTVCVPVRMDSLLPYDWAGSLTLPLQISLLSGLQIFARACFRRGLPAAMGSSRTLGSRTSSLHRSNRSPSPRRSTLDRRQRCYPYTRAMPPVLRSASCMARHWWSRDKQSIP